MSLWAHFAHYFKMFLSTDGESSLSIFLPDFSILFSSFMLCLLYTNVYQCTQMLEFSFFLLNFRFFSTLVFLNNPSWLRNEVGKFAAVLDSWQDILKNRWLVHYQSLPIHTEEQEATLKPDIYTSGLDRERDQKIYIRNGSRERRLDDKRRRKCLDISSLVPLCNCFAISDKGVLIIAWQICCL